MPSTQQPDPKAFFAKQQNEIEKMAILKRWREDPDKLITFLDMRSNYWRAMSNQIPDREYEKSFPLNLYQQHSNKLDVLRDILDLGQSASANVWVTAGFIAAKTLADTGQLLADMQGADRIRLAREIMNDPAAMESIVRDLDIRPKWRTAIGEGVSFQKGEIQKAWIDIMKRDDDYFYGPDGLGLPRDPAETVGTLDVFHATVFANQYIAFVNNVGNPTSPSNTQIKNAKDEVEGLNLNNLSLGYERFYIDKIEGLKAAEPVEGLATKMAQYKSYGRFIGYLVGIDNPKLGDAISKGSASLIDAYSSFKSLNSTLTIANLANLASGVGAVLTVVSIIQGLNSPQEDPLAVMFKACMEKINENINQLREEIRDQFEETFRQLGDIMTAIQQQGANANQQFANIVSILNEYAQRDLESDFQTALQETTLEYEAVSKFSDGQHLYEVLNRLYLRALGTSYIERFVRLNESIAGNYRFLDLRAPFINDGFTWSPIERRPALIHNLITAIKTTDTDKESVLGSIRQAVVDLGIDKFVLSADVFGFTRTLFNPVLCSQATQYFSEIMSYAYQSNQLYVDESIGLKWKLSMSEKFSNLYGANKWFATITDVCSAPEVVSRMLDLYLEAAATLHHYLYQCIGITRTNETDYVQNETDYVQKLAFHNQINSQLFKEAGLNIYNCFGPLVDKVEAKFGNYLTSYKVQIEAFSNVLTKLAERGNLTLSQRLVEIVGRTEVNTSLNNGLDLRSETQLDVTLKIRFSAINDLGTICTFDVLDKRKADDLLHLGIVQGTDASQRPQFRVPYPPNIGTGMDVHTVAGIDATVEHDHIQFAGGRRIELSKGFYEEDLKARLAARLVSRHVINDFCNGEDLLKASILFPKVDSKSYVNVDLTHLQTLIETCQKHWINLSTAVLCNANGRRDFSNYFTMLSDKPSILNLPAQLNDGLITGIIGDELKKLYLTNILEVNGKSMEIRISEPIERENIAAPLTEELPREVHYLRQKGGEESVFRVSAGLKEKLFTALTTVSSEPYYMESVTAFSQRAAESCEEAMNVVFSLGCSKMLEAEDNLG